MDDRTSGSTDAGDDPSAIGELDEMRAALEGLRALLDEEQRRFHGLLAEFDNFRQRTMREYQAAVDAGRRRALLPLLDVLDAFDQALAAGSSDRNFYEGLAATRRLFLDALRRAGAERIAAVGEPFDPAVHAAIGTEKSAGVSPGTVVRESRSGWRLGSEVLRPAEVIVAAPDDY